MKRAFLLLLLLTTFVGCYESELKLVDKTNYVPRLLEEGVYKDNKLGKEQVVTYNNKLGSYMIGDEQAHIIPFYSSFPNYALLQIGSRKSYIYLIVKFIETNRVEILRPMLDWKIEKAIAQKVGVSLRESALDLPPEIITNDSEAFYEFFLNIIDENKLKTISEFQKIP